MTRGFRAPLGGGESLSESAQLGAVGLAALAFSAGLYVQVGLPFLSALIVGMALFLVLGAALSALARTRRYADSIETFDDSVRHIEALSGEMRDIELLSDQGNRLHRLEQRIADLERNMETAAAFARPGADDPQAMSLQATKTHRIEAEVDRLSTRLEALRGDLDFQAREHQEKLSAELKMLETLIKQMAEKMTADADRTANQTAAPTADRQHAGSAASAEESPRARQRAQTHAAAALRAEGPRADAPGTDAPRTEAPAAETYKRPQPRPAARNDAAVLEAVRRSIEANKVDLYLQPIVTLPQRRVRYYEALTRLRDAGGRLLLPRDYLRVAESAGMMPLIDNVMLFRSVQVLRRLSERSSARGVFCNISLHSLLDPEFFPEFVAFMEQNQELASSLHFEFTQAMIASSGAIEQESLQSLARLGFRFGLDQVSDLDVDFEALYARGFRFVKIDADMLLHRSAAAGARIHPADMRAYLERHGLQMVVEKIEEEHTLTAVLDHDVKLGQGFLFSEPRPVRPEVFETPTQVAAA